MEHVEQRPRSADQLDRRGLIVTPAPVVAILLGLGASANAQAIPWTKEEIASPWNAQRIFEPTAPPDLSDPNSREEIPPEDMPVKKRQHPGYEPVGIRAGSWMFNPSLISGGFFDSNVFSIEHRGALGRRGGVRALRYARARCGSGMESI